ncbi:DUF7002 family protein [Phycicoccus mangrovi]|uniref:DUF7002 family protein n=1 Tax=Phycicoccus mangrovi TaxID=2840470 RepID=UPI001BFFE05F|nr:hypothetical protein [Phycicoccus mangrovi]
MTEDLIARHPRVFHVASAASWPSIKVHGLLSTTALLDLHRVGAQERNRLLRRRRTESTQLQTPGVGLAVIRDQKPLKFIDQKIEPTSSLELFLEALSSRVFFAPTRERLERLLNAREYRGSPQIVLTLDTRTLVSRYEHVIRLCRFNSGACTQVNHPSRGHESWQPISSYPYEEYRRRYKGVALVEVTVLQGVPDILEMTTHIEELVP